MIDETLDDDLETEIDESEEESSDEGDEEGHEEGREVGDEEGSETESVRQGQEGREDRVLSKGRGNAHFSKLRSENRALKESQESIRRELDAVRAEQQRRQQQPDPAQERMRYEAMSEVERLQYDFNRGRHEDRQQRHALEARLWAASDKTEFHTLCSTNEKAAKRADWVEKEFQDRFRTGKAVERQILLRWKIGDDVLKSRSLSKRAASGRKNIDRQRTKPMSGRGDTGGERRGGKSAAERLEGVTF